MSKIKVITLKNSNGLKLQISNLGATIICLNVPDKNNELVNVVAGLEASDYDKDFYIQNGLYLGASIGRFAGRISKGNFKLNDQEYPLYNVDGVHLHGGKVGFDKKFWAIESLSEDANPVVIFSCESKNMEEGYPGNLKVKVSYQLTEENQVKVKYSATTDADTPINLTNHAYFNLNGKDSILDHNLQLNSIGYLEVNDQLIPSGNIIPSKGTRFDFSEKEVIGREDFVGFDDCFILGQDELKAVLEAPKTGIKMEVYTNQPASVIYTPVQLPDLPYKNDIKYSNFSAICFETQNFTDAPNNENFPSSILKPGETYVNLSVYKFTIEK